MKNILSAITETRNNIEVATHAELKARSYGSLKLLGAADAALGKAAAKIQTAIDRKTEAEAAKTAEAAKPKTAPAAKK